MINCQICGEPGTHRITIRDGDDEKRQVMLELWSCEDHIDGLSFELGQFTRDAKLLVSVTPLDGSSSDRIHEA